MAKTATPGPWGVVGRNDDGVWVVLATNLTEAGAEVEADLEDHEGRDAEPFIGDLQAECNRRNR